ncbi:MAG: flagellar hook-length control protein FliK, partial [Planctomycetota bacterium]
LSAPERDALLEIASAREREALEGAPRLADLARAHRALLALQGRAAASRLGSLASSGPAASFSYFEIPVWRDGGEGTARVRVSVRRSGDGAGRGAAGEKSGRRRSTRAVLDLRVSELGEVWTEAVLTGKRLAVRVQLPDAARRDFVAERLPELEERLAAHGLEPAARAVAQETAPPDALSQTWPERTADGRIDLWV